MEFSKSNEISSPNGENDILPVTKVNGEAGILLKSLKSLQLSSAENKGYRYERCGFAAFRHYIGESSGRH